MKARSLFQRTAVLAAVVSSVGVFAPAQASAASRISACFSYAGVRYSGLSTNIEYKTTGGGWAYLARTAGQTRSNGCVAYKINRPYRSWYLRIKATASVPNWRGVFKGATPYYGPAGGGSWKLGEGRLGFYTLPPSVPTAPTFGGVNTSDWLNGMTGSAGPNCSSSTSMLVACYMDRHGLHGNVVVPIRDYDHDGWTDERDNYPSDPLWR